MTLAKEWLAFSARIHIRGDSCSTLHLIHNRFVFLHDAHVIRVLASDASRLILFRLLRRLNERRRLV